VRRLGGFGKGTVDSTQSAKGMWGASSSVKNECGVLEKQPTVQVQKDETGVKQPASRNGGEERAAGTGDGLVITEPKGQIQEQEEVEVSRWCHNLRREVEWVSPGSEKGGCRNSR
jgi:hypothetical protein